MIILYVLYGALLASSAALVFIGHSNWHGWSIEHLVKPIDLLTLILNGAIALLLQNYILKRGTSDRVEKDLIIDDLKKVAEELESAHVAFARRRDSGVGTMPEWRDILRACKRVSLAIERLETTLDVVSCGTCKKIGLGTGNIKSEFVKYKSVVTSPPPATVIAQATATNEELHFSALMKSLKRLIIKINSH